MRRWLRLYTPAKRLGTFEGKLRAAILLMSERYIYTQNRIKRNSMAARHDGQSQRRHFDLSQSSQRCLLPSTARPKYERNKEVGTDRKEAQPAGVQWRSGDTPHDAR